MRRQYRPSRTKGRGLWRRLNNNGSITGFGAAAAAATRAALGLPNRYRAIITGGTSTVVQSINQLGGTPAVANPSTGIYTVTITGAFTNLKTYCWGIVSDPNNGFFVAAVRTSADVVTFYVFDAGNSLERSRNLTPSIHRRRTLKTTIMPTPTETIAEIKEACEAYIATAEPFSDHIDFRNKDAAFKDAINGAFKRAGIDIPVLPIAPEVYA